ncbi:L-amino acid N-acyltransferase YncA [Tamaricihabitans halophyticus]|uniref:L-amino acid N-acyltransferase YncA n=1 Tax=Tamaricihabitans halophyticus TaxID=1262583 RepID=A0A4R2QQ96_9PSEU|nr:GNAT family N-acetyltransferase [Tamaricihabitans halophyticus]TCP49201.1 L-amino acid N-acyltransferase YncA [Tamaricihabitans halophyticus]
MPDSRIRPARPDDVPAVVELVHALADYQGAAHKCQLTVEQLNAALFGPKPALFGFVAVADDQVAGMALWFLNFSTWTGTHGVYLEDLYVRDDHRGSGLGKALLATLAEECVRNGYQRMEWSVLEWNTPAINVYDALGAAPAEETLLYRLSGDALSTLAGSIAPALP